MRSELKKLILVDYEDTYLLSEYKWYVSTGGYVVAGETGKTHNNRRKFYLHRLIISCPDEMQVDHINLNKLDNRRSNLRICTDFQNKANRKAQSNSTHGFKGITFNRGKWVTRIQINKTRFTLGRFNTKEQASLAYIEATRAINGEFANY